MLVISSLGAIWSAWTLLDMDSNVSPGTDDWFNRFEFKVFFFLDCLPYQVKEHSLSYYLSIAERKVVGSIQSYKCYRKWKQPLPGFELGLLCPFSKKITITRQASTCTYLHIYMYVCVCVCVLLHKHLYMYICFCLVSWFNAKTILVKQQWYHLIHRWYYKGVHTFP